MSAPTPRLSLEQFAGISAALAENLPLARVLEQEQVEEADYRDGEIHWRKEIAESIPLQLEYTAKLRIAEDCLARKLNPISDDPGAWVGLLAALATTSDQAELLSKLGISMNDVGRLGRAWKERARKEPEIGQRLAELAKNPTTPEKITAGPVELRPFPWTPPPKPKQALPEPPAKVPAVSMPAQEDGAVKRQLASFQVVAQRSAQEQQAASPWAQEAQAAPPSVAEPPSSFAGWSIDHYVHLVYELRANPTQAETTLVRAGLVTAEHRRELHAHFHRRFEAEPGLRIQYEEKLTARSQPPSAARPAPLGATAATEEVDVSMLRRRAVPFAGADGARVDPSRKREQLEADERLAKHKPEDAAVLARMKAAFQRPPAADSKGTAETAFVEESAFQPALPFAAPSSEPRPAVAQSKSGPESTGAPPRNASLGGTAAIEEDEPPQPLGWSFERYCRFCIDIQLQGLSEEAALAASNIGRRERQLLDAYWQPRLASDQALRLAWLRLSNQRAAELRKR